MVSSTDRTIFGFFKPHLENTYEAICGDRPSYGQLDERAFRQFLRDHYTLSRVPMTNDWADMIRNAFVDFLGGGVNCPEQSTYKLNSQRATIAPGDRPSPALDARTAALSVPAAARRGPQFEPTRPGETPRELIEAADQLTGGGLAERSERPTAEMRVVGENAPPVAPPAIPTPSREPPAGSTTVSLSSETRAVEISAPDITGHHGVEGIMDQYRERLRQRGQSQPGAQLPQPQPHPAPAAVPPPLPPRRQHPVQAPASFQAPSLPPRPVIVAPPPVSPQVERPAIGALPVPPLPHLPPRPVPLAPPPLPPRPAPVAPQPASAAAPSSSSQLRLMTDETLTHNLQTLQTEIGNVHMAVLSNLQRVAPKSIIYRLLIHAPVPSAEGKLVGFDQDLPYRVRFHIEKGGIIVRIEILDEEANRFERDLAILADEYNQEQMALLEHLLVGDPSVDDTARKKIGEAIAASREIASTPPNVVLFAPEPVPAAATPPPPAPPRPAAPADVLSAVTRDLPARSEQPASSVPAQPGAPVQDAQRESAPTTTVPAQSGPLPAVPPPSVTGENLRETVLRWTGAFPPQLGGIQIIGGGAAFEAQPVPPFPLPGDLSDTLSPEMKQLQALLDQPASGADDESLPPVESRLSSLPAMHAPGGGPGLVIVPPEMSVVTGHTEPLASSSAPARPVGSPPPPAPAPAARPNGHPHIVVGPSQAEARASTPPPARSTDPLVIDANANRIRAIQLAKDIENAKTPAALLRAWTNFRTVYFDILGQVTSLMQAIGSSGRFSSMPEHYDEAARQNIFQLTTRADALINEVMKALDAKLAKVRKPKSAEMALVMAQRDLMNGLREKADALRTAASASGRGTDVIIRQNFAAFRDEMNRLTSPITWTEALLGELKKFKKYRSRLEHVTTTMVGDMSKLKLDDPSQFTSIIEMMILEAAKWHWHDVRLNFEWNQNKSSRGFQGTLVITSPKNQLKRFKRDREFAARIRALDGSWNLPGRISRHLRNNLSGFRVFGPPMHRLSIPIADFRNSQPSGSQGSGSTRNSPPPPAPPAAGASTGGSLAERVSGLEKTLLMEIEEQGESSEVERTITGFQPSGETSSMSGYGPQIPITVTTPASSFFGSFMNFFGMPAAVPQTLLPLGGFVFQGAL